MDRQTAISFIRRFINPNYDENNYAAVKKLEQEFASTRTGVAGGNLISFNQATGHLGQLYDASLALQNGNVRGLNAIANAVSAQTGRPVVPSFEAIRGVLVGELGRLMKQAAPDVKEMEEINKAMRTANSPAQMTGVAQQYAHAMLAKSSAQINHYYSYTGELPPSTFTPQSRQVYERMGLDLSSVLPPGAVTPEGQTGRVNLGTSPGGPPAAMMFNGRRIIVNPSLNQWTYADAAGNPTTEVAK